MTQAKSGDTVRVNYTGRLDDGTIFDTSMDGEPLEFKIGDGQIIPDFEEAVIGMRPGESKTVKILSKRAYGTRQEDLVIVVNRKEIPPNIKPKVDQQLRLTHPDGHSFIVVVTDITEDTVTLDANHPLAGNDLTFDIQLVEIV